MSDSSLKKKEDFLIYILQQKYNFDYKDKSFKEILEVMDMSPDLKKILKGLVKKNPTFDEIRAIIWDLDFFFERAKDDELNEATYDFLFCLMNSNTNILKSYKDPDKNLDYLGEAYDHAFKANKSYFKSFNSKKVDTTKNKKDFLSNPVVTRFPPEPSGCLHIGHVKALLVNYNMATNSKGKFLLRFDDTNPLKDYERYEKEILRDLETLNISGFTISHSSDHFDLLVEKAKLLITNDKAYVDDTDQETMRAERFDGVESKNRNNTVTYNMEIFDNMLQGKAPGFCLRAKIDMSNPNKTMRDPVIYRCSDKLHCRNNKYMAYPTYDFVCPIIDSLEGVTVACRADEYKDRNDQYRWFTTQLNIRCPDLFDFSKLNLENTVMSKRKIDKLIQEKCVTGWDDPRLSTVQGIKRLGMDMTALKEYINLQGASNKTNIISWDKIWAMNKKAIDPVSPRYMVVEKNNCVRVTINENCYKVNDVLLHKKNADLGTKKVIYDNIILISQEDASILKQDEEFTLMNWGNAIVRNKLLYNNLVVEMTVDLNLEGDYKTTANKISWISEIGSVLIKGVEYGNILINDEVNPESKKEIYYYAESGLICKEGSHVQFERIGFYYCDKPYVFHLVPFTKQKRKY